MPRVLLIDDDKTVRNVLRRQFEKAGWAVTEAADGQQGIRELESDSAGFNFVLTDLIMPNKEGITTIREIRQGYPGLKIVAMTSGGQANHAEFLNIAKQMGADMAIQKPFKVAQLLNDIGPVE